MERVIRVESLGKQYRIGIQDTQHQTLREAIVDVAAAPIRRFRRLGGKPDVNETIWALRDVSFDVRQGEIVGIIGRNGAGKSTLLKILSRVTEPTEGMVEFHGRIASLLDVGTGFHPELTGRENIYLNSVILGMKKSEVDRKFQDIVAFSEIEKFLDTPVKRYSSGMYVRLAFAVAAHLESEILLVDEVLAVGDAAFQRKCLGKMEEVSKAGRTVLFVSHNMQAIRNLCSRTIFLGEGRVISDAPTGQSLSHYSQHLREQSINANTAVHDGTYRRGGGAVRFTSFKMEDDKGKEQTAFEMGETIRFILSYKLIKAMRGLTVYIGLRSNTTREFVTTVRHLLTADIVDEGSSGTVRIELPNVYIRPGEYPLYLHISESVRTKTNFDVLDDLTVPLVITAGNNQQHSDFDPLQPIGYFSVPSNIYSNKMVQ